MATYKFIKFTGDYSKLKSMGYEFQRLYANNYMQWSKPSNGEWSPTTRVWKKGADVTMDALTNYEGAFFELYMDYKTRGEELPWHTSMYHGKTTYLRVITNNVDHSISFDYNLYIEQERANTKHFETNDELMTFDYAVVSLTNKTLQALDEFVTLGWVELGKTEVQD
jgi:hypothetical protein